MAREPLTNEAILTKLEHGPAWIAERTVRFDEEALQTPPEPGAWSINAILAHLRACGDVWGGCIARLLAEDRPTIRAVDPRTWLEQTDYRTLPFRDSLAAFTAQRSDLLATLSTLAPGDWERAATITGAGKPLQRTVRFYAGWLVRHEGTHLKQIDRLTRTEK